MKDCHEALNNKELQFSLKYYKPEFLIPIALVLAFIFDALVVFVIEQFPSIEILRAPSNSVLIAFFLGFHNRYLWHLKAFNWLVKVPDMRGRYSGKINYTWDGQDGSKDCKVELTQTASTVSIRCYFKNEEGELTSSKSLVEEIREEDGFYSLYFFYLNSGTLEDNKLDCHEGANTLKFIPATASRKAKLTGNYFTNRQTQTRGTIHAEFESKTLDGEF